MQSNIHIDSFDLFDNISGNINNL